MEIQNGNIVPGNNDEMATLSEVLEKLRLKKMDTEFRLENGYFTAGKQKNYTPEDLVILKTCRFEGQSDPSDSSILYIFKATDGLIGYSLNAYGIYSDHDDEAGYDNFIRKVKVQGHEDQLSFQL
jgi:hypothetical protein